MSLELKIEALTAAVIALTSKLESNTVTAAVPVAPTPAPVVKAAPVVKVAPVVELEPVAQAPVMPAPPSFVIPPLPAAPTGAPFTDAKGLMDYVMTSYKAMGQDKGAGIQGVLTTLGYQNINEIKPEHYSALYAGVEALK